MNLRGIKIPTADDVNKAKCRKSHIDFMEYTWQQKGQPFIKGVHTEEISKWLDEAFEKYKNGISSYAMIRVPFRHGKSQLISRSAVPHFLGEFPEGEVIVTAYNTQTAQKFSKDAKTIMESREYLELYPNSTLNPDNKGVAEWGMSNRVGGTLWSGLDGSLTGSGANFAIVDDPFKGRAEANSLLIREKRWESFTEAFMTRLAPTHIVLVVATPWDVDDFFGRIENAMKDNPEFPRFEDLTFPAKAEDYKGKAKYRGTYLFPERFDDNWYTKQYSTLGKYASTGLLDCSPKKKGGNLIPAEEGINWHWVDEKPEKFSRLYRCWDLASTKKNATNDPDYTVGTKLAIKVEVHNIGTLSRAKTDKLKSVSIYIDDILRIREDAVNRNTKMILTAKDDGATCINFVESFGAHKDTTATLKSILGGSRIVKAIRHKGDKEYKITEALEIPFQYGTVYVNRKISKKLWQECCDELEAFPFGSHDDLCLPHYSKIDTPNGHVEIKEISEGDDIYSFVNGQKMISKVSTIRNTGIKEIVEIEFSDGSIFEASENHPILTLNGWVETSCVRLNDLIAKDVSWSKNLMDSSSRMRVSDIINLQQRLMVSESNYTDTSGKFLTVEKFQMVITSIILMVIEITTKLKTSYSYQSTNTANTTVMRNLKLVKETVLSELYKIDTLVELETLQFLLKKVYLKVKGLRDLSELDLEELLSVINVDQNHRLINDQDLIQDFVQTNVVMIGGSLKEEFLTSVNLTTVSSVIQYMKTLSELDHFAPNHVKMNVFVDEIEYATVKSVKRTCRYVEMYNILVEDSHNFVADGVITHNCDSLAIGVNELTSKQYSAWWVNK